MSVEYIYLLQDSAAVRSNQSVYKIGKTIQSNYKGIHNYPKGYKIILHTSCSDSVKCKTDILKLFKTKYIPRTDFGNEYFEGNYRHMKIDINRIIFENDINESDDNTKLDNNINELEYINSSININNTKKII